MNQQANLHDDDGHWPTDVPLKPNTVLSRGEHGIFRAPLPRMSPGMKANADFFSHPVWAARYFEVENHPGLIAERWRAAIGDWSDKIVVDLEIGRAHV